MLTKWDVLGRRTAAVVVSAFVSMDGMAAAQDAARTFEELRGQVEIGETVYVTDRTGRETSARLVELSASSLVLTVGDARRDLTEGEVARIRQRRPDPLWTGAAIGAGVGIALGASAAGLAATFPDDEVSLFPGLLVFAGLGAGVGAGIDALIVRRATIYEAPGRASVRLGVRPLLGRGRAGVAVTVARR